MIVHLRMDERLIHGQITTVWSKALDIDSIVCANDSAANDPIHKAALMTAKPAGKKVAIKSVDDAIKLLKDPRAENMKVLVLSGNPKDTLKIVKEFNIKEVNIANYMMKKSPNKIKIAKYCAVDEEDLNYLKELAEIAHVYSHMVPNYPIEELGKKLKEM